MKGRIKWCSGSGGRGVVHGPPLDPQHLHRERAGGGTDGHNQAGQVRQDPVQWDGLLSLQGQGGVYTVQGFIAKFSDSPPPPPNFLLLLLPEEVIGDPGSLTRSTTFEWSPIFSSSFPPSPFLLLLLWLFCHLLKKVG